MNTKLWIPDNESVKNSLVSQFQTYLSKQYQYTGASFTDLHEWSVSHSPQFWKSIWAFCDVKASSQGNTVVHNVEAMPGAKWFPEAKLNFAENLCLPAYSLIINYRSSSILNLVFNGYNLNNILTLSLDKSHIEDDIYPNMFYFNDLRKIFSYLSAVILDVKYFNDSNA